MGAWSHEPFGNDTSNDWAYGLEGTSDLSHIEAALDNALGEEDEYLDASIAEEAIGAIEVIAKLLGRGTQSDVYTEKVDAWVSTIKQKPGPELINKARQVIALILSSDSELNELWQESDEYSMWQASMAQLQAAVSA